MIDAMEGAQGGVVVSSGMRVVIAVLAAAQAEDHVLGQPALWSVASYDERRVATAWHGSQPV